MTASRAVVVTTINPPTRAVDVFSALADWSMVVVGDRKTPAPWASGSSTFLAFGDPSSERFGLAAKLPADHYSRKMLGYLHAAAGGAEVIADTDDDNLPNPDWGFPPFSGRFQVTASDRGFVNVYRAFTDQHIWPRGFPLREVLDEGAGAGDHGASEREVEVGVWQGLADGDPDVDAIYRLTCNLPCTFDEREPLVLGAGTLCPYNSQNTACRRELFALLYLPALVTFRFTDILRGLIAQPVMWAAGFRLGFLRATVFQDRNEHDYLRDFESEIPCYLETERVVDAVGGAVSDGASVAENLHSAYRALLDQKIVVADELRLLEVWLDDLSAATDGRQ